MKRYTVLFFAIMVIAFSAMQVEAKCRKGIQRNIPIYVQHGVLCQQQADGVMNAINEKIVEDCTLFAGTVGDNYWVDEQTGTVKVIRGYVIPEPGRKARKIAGFTFFQTCDNLFVPRQIEAPDQVLLKPAPQPEKKVFDVNLTVAPLRIEPLKVDSNIHLKVDPLQVNVQVDATIKDNRPQQPIIVTVVNQQAAASIPYFGSGGCQAGWSTSSYQIGTLMQQQLYPQQGQPINVTAIGAAAAAAAASSSSSSASTAVTPTSGASSGGSTSGGSGAATSSP